MKFVIGVPREIKAQEGRVALMPSEVKTLAERGYTVLVETGAGVLSGQNDADYLAAGAEIVSSMAELYQRGNLIAKVKEFLAPEYELIRSDHVLLTNIHSALNPELTDVLLNSQSIAIAAEDTHRFGSPNCPLAGEIGAFEGVRLCLAPHGGTGRHFIGHYGASPIRAIIIGLGAVGQGALRTLARLGCSVVGLDIDPGAIQRTQLAYDGQDVLCAPVDTLHDYLDDVDLIVNCVLWPKHRDDHLISRSDLNRLKKTCVVADISCDEAGAIETCRPTSWAEPTYKEEGITHFCVDNIPGAAPVAASAGYSRALLPKIIDICGKGALQACRDDEWLARGLVCADGTLVHKETAVVQARQYTPVQEFLES